MNRRWSCSDDNHLSYAAYCRGCGEGICEQCSGVSANTDDHILVCVRCGYANRLSDISDKYSTADILAHFRNRTVPQ